jgi:hypothetical protein
MDARVAIAEELWCLLCSQLKEVKIAGWRAWGVLSRFPCWRTVDQKMRKNSVLSRDGLQIIQNND